MRHTTILMSLLALVVLSMSARAQGSDGPEQIITWAKSAEAELEYDRALELWNTVIAHPGVTQAQRLEASVHAGSIERIRGNQLQARVHFMYVLDQDIDYQLSADTEPKIRDFFEMIRAEMKQKAAPAAGAPTAVTGAPTGGVTGGGPGGDADTGEKRAEPAADGPGALTFMGAAVIGLGVVVAGLAGTSGVLSNQEQEAAIQSSEQLEREARYDQRDVYSNLANGGWAASGVLVLAGTGVILIDVTRAEGVE